MASAKDIIANRVALEVHDGDVVNLGIGIPTLVTQFLPEGVEVAVQSENGIIGMAGNSAPGTEDLDTINSGGAYVDIIPGGVFFDSATSFALIRGGHVDVTVLGALQVDQEGNLASHKIPGKMVPGMGGAMDLVVGAKKVIIAMTHTQKGAPKIFEKVSLPVTAVKCVDLIVTEMGVMEVTDAGLALRELAPGVSFDDIQAVTMCPLIVEGEIKEMPMPKEA